MTTRGGVRLQIPDEELPPAEWFGIARIVADLELLHVDWGDRVLDGYFCDPAAVWER